MALTEWSAFIAAAAEKGLQAPPVALVVKGVGTNDLYLLEADSTAGGLVVAGSFTASTSGLTTAGKITVVTITDAAWTALPATPFAGRNQLNLQNESDFNLKLNYSNLVVGYVGITVAAGNERQYLIKDSIVIYAKAAPGTGTWDITVEEIA